jgi:hypothetical protein
VRNWSDHLARRLVLALSLIGHLPQQVVLGPSGIGHSHDQLGPHPVHHFALYLDRAAKRTAEGYRLRERFRLLDTCGGKMFSHIFVGSDDVAISKKFYDAVLGAIGVPEGKTDAKGRVFYRTPSGTFGISKPIDGNLPPMPMAAR